MFLRLSQYLQENACVKSFWVFLRKKVRSKVSMCEYFSNEISSSLHSICFLKLRFTQRKAEQPLKDMGLQEKEETHVGKLFTKNPKIKGG